MTSTFLNVLFLLIHVLVSMVLHFLILVLSSFIGICYDVAVLLVAWLMFFRTRKKKTFHVQFCCGRIVLIHCHATHSIQESLSSFFFPCGMYNFSLVWKFLFEAFFWRLPLLDADNRCHLSDTQFVESKFNACTVMIYPIFILLVALIILD